MLADGKFGPPTQAKLGKRLILKLLLTYLEKKYHFYSKYEQSNGFGVLFKANPGDTDWQFKVIPNANGSITLVFALLGTTKAKDFTEATQIINEEAGWQKKIGSRKPKKMSPAKKKKK
jgi:hypothetical protein